MILISYNQINEFFISGTQEFKRFQNQRFVHGITIWNRFVNLIFFFFLLIPSEYTLYITVLLLILKKKINAKFWKF